MVVSRIVFRAEVLQSKRPHRRYLRDVLARFRPVEMGRIARENNHGPGWIGLQLTRVEFITESDIKNAGNHGINSILGVPVRHQLYAVGHLDPDGVWAGLRRLTHDDGEPGGRWERRERLPIDIFGQDGFENLLTELVRPDFALLGMLYGAGFLRHTILLRAENLKQHHRLSKQIRRDWPQTHPVFKLSGLRIASGAGLARDLAQVVSEAIFDIARLVEATRHERLDPVLGGGSPERSDARIPTRAQLDVRRQAGVDEALGVGDRPFVEPGDPGRERIDERLQFGVGQRAIDVAVGLGPTALMSSELKSTSRARFGR